MHRTPLTRAQRRTCRRSRTRALEDRLTRHRTSRRRPRSRSASRSWRSRGRLIDGPRPGVGRDHPPRGRPGRSRRSRCLRHCRRRRRRGRTYSRRCWCRSRSCGPRDGRSPRLCGFLSGSRGHSGLGHGRLRRRGCDRLPRWNRGRRRLFCDGFEYVSGLGDLGKVDLGLDLARRGAALFGVSGGLSLDAEVAAHLFRFVRLDGAGVRLFFLDADLRQEVEDRLALDLQLPGQIVDANLFHAPFCFLRDASVRRPS